MILSVSQISVFLFRLFIVTSFFAPLTTMAQKKGASKTPTQIKPQDDRTIWSEALFRIAYPVINNLANGTLQKNMPAETPSNYYLDVKSVTYLEAVGRTFAGVAPWLALPDDQSEEGKIRKNLRFLAIKGLTNAVDPQSDDYLNFRKGQQPLVDAAFVAQAFLRAPEALWNPLDSLTKSRYVHEFKSLRGRKPAYNNWLLFSGITEAFLLSIDAGHDPLRLDIAFRKMQEWYAGDGWYSDGPLFSFDYYNSFVIHPMLVDMLKVMAKKKLVDTQSYDLAIKRMMRYAEFLERLIAPDGTFPVFGRSMTYRTAAFQALAQSVLYKKIPESLTAGQIRGGLTTVIRNMFSGNQNFDSNGWLVLGFNGHQPSIADPYTSTGSLYMATLAFLPLGLPSNDPFWTSKTQKWTSLKAWNGDDVKKDYKVDY